jgi:hypothetical protein
MEQQGSTVMNRFRLRGTWEDDPAPLPFPGVAAGRQAGAPADAASDTAADEITPTDDVIRGVEAEFERASLKIDELRSMLEPFDGDPPPAA